MMSLEKTYFLILMAGILCLITSSCHISKPFQQADFMPGGLYRDITASDSTTIANMPWQKIFPDSLLQHLIDEGLQNNTDLQIAEARLNQAYANFRQSRAMMFPTMNLEAQGMWGKNNIGTSGQLFQLSGSSSWELDLWGKFRNVKKSNLMIVRQSEAYKRAVQTQLISSIATGYFTLLAYDAQYKITLSTLVIRKKDVQTIKLLKESNVVTGAAVVQSEAARYSAEVTLPDLERNIREMENNLSVLIGRSPGSIQRTTLEEQQAVIDMKVGLPLQLLANRPDVLMAEYQLRSATALVHTARSYFYPAINLTAQGGWSNTSLARLLNASSLFGNLVGGLTQPIFNQGLNKQRLALAKAREEEYLADFKQSILNAGQEVSDALFKYQTANDKLYIRDQQILFLQKAVEYTKELLRYTSGTNFTDVLTSEESLLAAQLNSVNDKLQQLQAIISLYHSLGGGWK